MLEILYMRIETGEAGLRMDISYTSEPARQEETIVQYAFHPDYKY
jgi:hypothetical protein